MSNHTVTVEGVTRQLKGKFYKNLEPGEYFFDADKMFFRVGENGHAEIYKGGGAWSHCAPKFPIYEAIVVEKQPDEWREVGLRNEGNCSGGRRYQEALRYAIAETLKAQRIRIHNVDGSVSEFWCRADWASTSWESECFGWTDVLSQPTMQDRIQLAFMRGSKVEVLG